MGYSFIAQLPEEEMNTYWEHHEFGWPNDEYEQPLSFSCKFFVYSDSFPEHITDVAHEEMTPTDIQRLTDAIRYWVNIDAFNVDDIGRLADMVDWLDYWADEGVAVRCG